MALLMHSVHCSKSISQNVLVRLNDVFQHQCDTFYSLISQKCIAQRKNKKRRQRHDFNATI